MAQSKLIFNYFVLWFFLMSSNFLGERLALIQVFVICFSIIVLFIFIIQRSALRDYQSAHIQLVSIMQQEDIRFIVNPFQKIVNIIKPDYDRLYNLLFNEIQQFIKGSQLPTLTAIASIRQKSQIDTSAYCGVGGYTYTLIRLAKFFSEGKMMKEETQKIINSSQIAEDGLMSQLKNKNYYLDLANEQYKLIVESFNKHKASRKTLAFYMSETCTWLCGMYLAYEARNRAMFRQNEHRLLQSYQYYGKQKGKMMNQLLYGTPGFLYVFLELQKAFDNHADENYRTNFKGISKALTIDIIESGIATFQQLTHTKIDVKKQLPENFRLAYLFHKKQYLGGAHGLGGNINIILLSFQLNEFPIQTLTMYCKLISKSILFLLKHFINGNFATSAGSQRVKLVHFCHGAPGIVSGLGRFMNMFPEDGIKLGIPQAIQKSLQHIWQYGILKKGFGLCHGISGNAYAFIAPSVQKAFPEMHDQYLKKAILFALLKQQKDVMKQIRGYNFSDRMRVGMSDEPYSLMLGVAGDICFLMDVISGVGKFPGFDF